MDYRNYVKQVITEYAQLGSAKDEIEQQLIFDTFGDHYQLMYVGWKNRKRQHGCVLHLDIVLPSVDFGLHPFLN
ncbi:fdxN element excision controlling factor protein XisI [Dolichospermum compactum NIES-806]|uniref:FdxN element excision controlling factor protein XisI n=1 Tax=Dolichospermum compactum NIES-806 TaxID=1973481 RepID=A0A1Z4UYW7_9CYAN|nr:fdxN element excision controlling factor protein XisI [Dolichospermum compactum NIES-806]